MQKTHWSREQILIAIFVIMLIVLSSLSHNNKSLPASNENAHFASIDVCVYSQSFAEKFLKAPGSAKFPECDDQKITNIGDSKWQVTSYVDSQNDFGALLRMHYTVIVQNNGSDNFILKYFRNDDTDEILFNDMPTLNVSSSAEQNKSEQGRRVFNINTQQWEWQSNSQ